LSTGSDDVLLGVDPGLGTTGWGVVKASRGRFVYVDSGRVRTTTRQLMGERLRGIFSELQRVADHYHATVCGVESGYVGAGARSALLLGQARAAAILSMETKGIPVTLLAPREVKLAVTGRGAASKAQVSYMVGKLLGLEFDAGEEDISDALAIAICLALHGSLVNAKAVR
jgi:crossover junction endodeoxyribonuclease RuvC